MIQGIFKGMVETGKTLLKNGSEIAVQHAPEILMGVGTASIVTGMIWGIRAGRAAVILQEDAEAEKAAEERRQKIASGEYMMDGHKAPFLIPLTWQEKIKVLAPVYIPPIGLMIFGVGCFFGAQSINMRRQAILAGLYATAQDSLEEYQRKVIELMGQKKHEDVKDAIAEDKEKDNQAFASVVLPGAGMNDLTCNLYGQLFPSSYVKIKEAQNEFNQEMIGELDSSKTLAELKCKLDPTGQYLPVTQADFDVSWSVDRPVILHVANPYGPIPNVTYEDKYGVENLPQPRFRCC